LEKKRTVLGGPKGRENSFAEAPSNNIRLTNYGRIDDNMPEQDNAE